MNKVILMGTLVADPELKTMQNGKSVCEFRIAVRRSFKNAQGQYDSDFLRCRAFGGTADIVGKYFVKGSRILVEGAIQTSSWTKDDGSKAYATDIAAASVEFVDKRGDALDTPPSNTEKKPAKSFKQQGFEEVADDDQLPF